MSGGTKPYRELTTESSSKDGQVEANLGPPEGLRARVPRQDTRAALAQGKANNLDRPHLYNLEEGPDEEGPDEEGPDGGRTEAASAWGISNSLAGAAWPPHPPGGCGSGSPLGL